MAWFHFKYKANITLSQYFWLHSRPTCCLLEHCWISVSPCYFSAAAQSNRRGRGRGNRSRGKVNVRRDGPMRFEEDFDFETANAQFHKDEIDKELQNKLKLKGTASTQSSPIVQRQETYQNLSPSSAFTSAQIYMFSWWWNWHQLQVKPVEPVQEVSSFPLALQSKTQMH